MQYPSGRTVNYQPDTAGRVQYVQNAATQTNYASVTYNATGTVSSVALGNGITEQSSWNDRVQFTALTATPSGGSSVLSLNFYPCASQATACATGNTGSIQSQTIAIPGLNSPPQIYTYDSVNRLSSISEGSGYSRSFAYNTTGGYNNGNMYVSANSGFPLASFTPTSSGNFNSQNQFAIPSSSYDSAGNQTAIGGLAPQFDAEGRMTSTSLNGTTVTYVYDGDGQRVMKQVSGSTTTTTVYVYDAFGNVAAEYTTPAPSSPCGTATCYVSVDHLGSTRLVTDSLGNVQKRYDYLPFGEELFAGIDTRTTAMGYQSAADGFSPRFTGQYRDLLPSVKTHPRETHHAMRIDIPLLILV
jgi:YD repeat-containing protein